MAWQFLTKIKGFLTGSGGNLVETLANTADRFIRTKDEKADFQREVMKIQHDFEKTQQNFMLEMERLTQQRESEIEETIRAELNAKKEVMLAELNQGDKYTKRARPTVVYVGLIFILLEVLGLRPLIINYIAGENLEYSKILLDSSSAVFNTFLLAWGGVLGVYSIGRSVEKRGTRKSWVSTITGNPKETSVQNEATDRAIVKDITNKIKPRFTWQQ